MEAVYLAIVAGLFGLAGSWVGRRKDRMDIARLRAEVEQAQANAEETRAKTRHLDTQTIGDQVRLLEGVATSSFEGRRRCEESLEEMQSKYSELLRRYELLRRALVALIEDRRRDGQGHALRIDPEVVRLLAEPVVIP